MSSKIPETMRAAVYRGNQQVLVEEVATPELGAGEILIRVESCGICHTDLKKIEYGLLAPPRDCESQWYAVPPESRSTPLDSAYPPWTHTA